MIEFFTTVLYWYAIIASVITLSAFVFFGTTPHTFMRLIGAALFGFGFPYFIYVVFFSKPDREERKRQREMTKDFDKNS